MIRGLQAGTKAERGFTLIELLVVLVILALVTVAFVPLSRPRNTPVGVTVAAREMMLSLRSARKAAIFSNKEVRFLVAADSGLYWSDAHARRQRLPPQVTASLSGTRQFGEFRFFPDGGASGGTIMLRAGQSAAVIRIDGLSGRVSLDAGR